MRSSSSRIGLYFIILFSLFLAGCSSGFVKSMSDIMVLRGAIGKEFKEENVSVTLNNSTFLIVNFVNSPLNNADWSERSKRAQATALFVKEHYPAIATIREMQINFQRHETHYLIVNYWEQLEGYRFDRTARPISENNGIVTPLEELQTVVRTNSSGTDISVNDLQLEGTPNDGVTLVPHFTVTGNVNASKGPPPEKVSFDFAAISRTERFPGETLVQIIIDGDVAFKGKGSFQGGQSNDGIYTRFLYVKPSYRQFRRITEGSEVVIRIGDQGYTLTEEQLAALREMRNYVQE
jgi:hypothetical protein